MLMAAPVTACGILTILRTARHSQTPPPSGGRGWLGTVGGGCDYQFGSGSGFWSNWVVGAFADYDFMDLHRNFQETFDGGIGDAKEKSAWAVGARIGYLVTPNVFTYWNGGYTETRFDQINLSDPDGDGTPYGVIGAHTYHGWFIGGGTEIALSGLFGLPLPTGLFWRSEYRYSSFSSADLPVQVQIKSPVNRPKHAPLCPDDHHLAGL